MEHVQPLTQPSSRLLLQQTVLELAKIENIALTWEQLQPLAINLPGRAAAMLDALQADTLIGTAELEHLAKQMEPWRQIIKEAASADSEQAEAWKEALLTAMSETVGATEAQARLDALLKGDAALLRIVELKRRAIQLTQSPFVAVHVAATAASFRLGSLAAYLVSRAQAEGEQDSSPLDAAALEQLVSFADHAEEFVATSFQQLHDLFACDGASVAAARSLARSILDEAGGRGRLLGEVLGAVSRQGIEPDSLVELGPVALRIAELGVRLSLLATYAAYVRAHAHSMAADSWLTSERKAAQLELASRVPTGQRASIDQLGSLDGDQLVEILGRVESLVINHDPAPPKFSSFVELRAFDGVASVRLRAHMFSLAKNGLVEGALCLVRAFVRRHESWLDADETGLDIDRVSLSKLRKESWLDDVAYRMRPFFRLYQDEMSLFHTPGGV